MPIQENVCGHKLHLSSGSQGQEVPKQAFVGPETSRT